MSPHASFFSSRTTSRSQADKAAELESARTTATSPTSPSPPSKALRAIEHDRQRTRKTADLVKKRALKEHRSSTPKPVEAKRSSSGGGGGGQIRKGKLLTEDELEMLDPTPVSTPLSHSKRESFFTVSAEPVRDEVKLVDLIVARKPRKGKDGDFEVIPHIRSVIVLDDNITHDAEPEEPWEHIDLEDEDDDEPSYAQVVSLAT